MLQRWGMARILILCLLFSQLSGCWRRESGGGSAENRPQQAVVESEKQKEPQFGQTRQKYVLTPGELRLRQMGMVDVAQCDPSIGVLMIYATADNFTKQVLYDDITRAFLRPEVADMVVEAQAELKRSHPELSLLVYDAARPLSVQRKMWEVVRGTPYSRFVSNPANGGGMHNYGAAVDLTLVDASGEPLAMGTPYDFFGPEAGIRAEDQLVADGKISPQAAANRRLLRGVMCKAGFIPLPSEWWHFNAVPTAVGKAQYALIE